MPPLSFFLLPSDRLVFSLCLSSLFFIFQNKLFIPLFGIYMLFLSIPKTEGLVLILAQWDHWGEAPRRNNIMTHKSGYVWGRSGDRPLNFLMWVNLGFCFPGALCFGPGMRGGRLQFRKGGFPQKFVQWKNIFSIRRLMWLIFVQTVECRPFTRVRFRFTHHEQSAKTYHLYCPEEFEILYQTIWSIRPQFNNHNKEPKESKV